MSQIIANSATVKQRDQRLDILKGIGIILMVVGHSGFPYANYIYLFHMALFFMASGYVWNDDKVRSVKAVGKATLSRVRSLWIPFAVGNGIFTLLNNWFVRFDLYSPTKNGMIDIRLTGKLFLRNLLFHGDTQFGGASWFLRTLFIISIAHILIRYIVCKMRHGNVLFAAVVSLTVVMAGYINQTRWELPFGLHTCFAAYFAFLLGVFLKKVQLMDRIGKYCPIAAVASFAVLVILGKLDTVGMGAGNIGSLPFFLAVSLAGWIMVWGLASVMKGWIGRWISTCGRMSIWILMLHFLAFKPVSFVYLRYCGWDRSRLSEFPTLANTSAMLWIAYSIAGVILPLIVGASVKWITERIRSLKK
jgi:fucose 4-O-acetylase-like acetyltransferase